MDGRAHPCACPPGGDLCPWSTCSAALQHDPGPQCAHAAVSRGWRVGATLAGVGASSPRRTHALHAPRCACLVAALAVATCPRLPAAPRVSLMAVVRQPASSSLGTTMRVHPLGEFALQRASHCRAAVIGGGVRRRDPHRPPTNTRTTGQRRHLAERQMAATMRTAAAPVSSPGELCQGDSAQGCAGGDLRHERTCLAGGARLRGGLHATASVVCRGRPGCNGHDKHSVIGRCAAAPEHT